MNCASSGKSRAVLSVIEIVRKIEVRVVAATLLASLCIAETAFAQDWPQWRGPDANGIARESFDPATLSPAPKVLWKASLGAGYSSPSVKDGLVYCMGNTGEKDVVTCREAETGRQVWSFTYACAEGSYPGPKATPTVDGVTVYTLSREGHLFALDAKTGQVRWARNLVKDFGVSEQTYDFSSSPVIFEDLLILNAGHSGLALDKRTGAKAWGGASGPAGYATPVLARMGNELTAVIFGWGAVFGVVPRTGAVKWTFDWENHAHANAADPAVIGQTVFVSGAYGKGCALYDVSGLTPKEVWNSMALGSHFSPFIVKDGFLYGVDGDARTPGAGSLRCVDLTTGKAAWSAPLGFGSLIAAENLLVFLGSTGTIVTADASQSAYVERSRGSLPRNQYWTPPALANGRLFIRNLSGDLFAVDVRKTGDPVKQ